MSSGIFTKKSDLEGVLPLLKPEKQELSEKSEDQILDNSEEDEGDFEDDIFEESFDRKLQFYDSITNSKLLNPKIYTFY